MGNYAAPLAAAVHAAREAGALLREDFHRPGGPRGSGSHGEVDREAEERIRPSLLEAAAWSYRGEETGQAGPPGGHQWLVDPNDGTEAFLRGFRGSAVSIAALRDGVPVLGVVYAFGWPDDEGTLIAWAEGERLTRNGIEVAPPAGRILDRSAVIAVSQDADLRPAANARCVSPGRFLALPSVAFRLALAAVGEVDGAVSLASPRDWDFAAGHALLRATGGLLLDDRGGEIAYAPDGEVLTRACYGGAPEVARALVERPWDEAKRGRTPAPSTWALSQPLAGAAERDPVRLQRAQGCLFGQLIGDALGALVEFRAPESIRRQYPEGVRELHDGGTHDTLAGQPTDDSELALLLARSLVAQRGWDEERVFEAYRRWYLSDPFDVGNTTARALGGDIPDARSQANGSLMRVSPIGIFCAGRPSQAAAWARADSMLTHPHPVCRDACAAFVAAIADGITHGDARQAWETAKAIAETDPVRETLARAGHGPPADFLENQGWVLLALQNAFHQLLHAPTAELALADTVQHGGDTDTNAAIAGALVGALRGREAWPLRWRRTVMTCRALPEASAHRPRESIFWGVDALVLAERLLVSGRDA
jgi:ADP-ribosylglycohydrolase/fructose-1,6-bisphosphatase/inositol monophosphatase family enzyme